MKHFISLDKAKKMTALYRKEKEHKEKVILPLSETFDAEPFRTILNKPGCVSIRIYYGMDDEKRVHAIIVGVNDKNEDMLSTPQSAKSALKSATITAGDTASDPPDPNDPTGDPSDPGETSDIIEDSIPCPPTCPPPSPLNG